MKLNDEKAQHRKKFPRGTVLIIQIIYPACACACVCVCPEHHADEWVRQRPSENAEESAQCQETPAGEDDSDTDLTYGEVEQRLDLLQQHLNRCEGGKRAGEDSETACWSCQTKTLHLNLL